MEWEGGVGEAAISDTNNLGCNVIPVLQTSKVVRKGSIPIYPNIFINSLFHATD